MKKFLPLGVVVILVILGAVLFIRKTKSTSATAKPTPTPTQGVQMLSSDKAPSISLKFSSDAHYVTVNISNIHADQLEYNLIYDATVKGNSINTGVNASAKMEGKADYTKQQLLGSESSGHFTYHANIKNAMMELTLRDTSGRSVFTATYPFEVKAGATASLTASQ